MTDLKLQNDKVRFEAKFGNYFFIRCLETLKVIDASVTSRKYKKFLAKLEEMFTVKTTMNDIKDLAIEYKIKVTQHNY